MIGAKVRLTHYTPTKNGSDAGAINGASLVDPFNQRIRVCKVPDIKYRNLHTPEEEVVSYTSEGSEQRLTSLCLVLAPIQPRMGKLYQNTQN